MEYKANEDNLNSATADSWLVDFEKMIDIENQIWAQSCASKSLTDLQVDNSKPEEPQSSCQNVYDILKENLFDVKDASFADDPKPRKSPEEVSCETTWGWRSDFHKDIQQILDDDECKFVGKSPEKASKPRSFQTSFESASLNSTKKDEDLFGSRSPPTAQNWEWKMGHEETNIFNHITFDDLDVKPTISDFDIMWQRSNASRKRAATLPLDYYSSKVDEFIKKMRSAAEADRELNMRKEPAYKKVMLLKEFMEMLNNQNLKHIFFEYDIYEVLAEWLTPLPSGALPCFYMRHCILQAMDMLPMMDLVTLKGYRIAKKVMFYWKHPNEERENRELAKRLIHKWARSFYNIPDDLADMSVEERRERDIFIKTKLIVGSKVDYKDMEKSFDFNRFADLNTPVAMGESVNLEKSSNFGDPVNMEKTSTVGDSVNLDEFEDGDSVISVKSSSFDDSAISVKSSNFDDCSSLGKSEDFDPSAEPSTSSAMSSNAGKPFTPWPKITVKYKMPRHDPIGRARVPEPSTKAYFIRPPSQVSTPFSSKPKKKVRRFNNRLVL